MTRPLQSIMVTGGSGFIGTNFIRHLFSRPEFTGRIINLDKLTYAGNPLNLKEIEECHGATVGSTPDAEGPSGGPSTDPRYIFLAADICDGSSVQRILEKYQIDTIVNFAAESHVDRSVYGPREFIDTNINGTFALLEAARKVWGPAAAEEGKLFHQVSTDEVFGSLGAEGRFSESSCYDPRSPYSASKAAADHLVRAAHHTYGLPVTISNCSNNYGPYQFPEKLIPLMLLNMLDEKPLPVYGDGGNVRDWLYVEDHVEAIWLMLRQAEPGASYNLGGDCELDNLSLVRSLCAQMAARQGKSAEHYSRLITFVKDRPGHDRRYAMDSSKIRAELGWRARTDFETGIARTIDWYLENRPWCEAVRSGEYRNWIEVNYRRR